MSWITIKNPNIWTLFNSNFRLAPMTIPTLYNMEIEWTNGCFSSPERNRCTDCHVPINWVWQSCSQKKENDCQIWLPSTKISSNVRFYSSLLAYCCYFPKKLLRWNENSNLSRHYVFDPSRKVGLIYHSATMTRMRQPPLKIRLVWTLETKVRLQGEASNRFWCPYDLQLLTLYHCGLWKWNQAVKISRCYNSFSDRLVNVLNVMFGSQLWEMNNSFIFENTKWHIIIGY